MLLLAELLRPVLQLLPAARLAATRVLQPQLPPPAAAQLQARPGIVMPTVQAHMETNRASGTPCPH
jgi:hypothetical protein